MANPRVAEILRTIGYGKPRFPTQDVDPDVLSIVLAEKVSRTNPKVFEGLQARLRDMSVEEQLQWWSKNSVGDPATADALLREAQRRTHRAYYGADRGPEGM